MRPDGLIKRSNKTMIKTAIFTLVLTAAFGISAISANAQISLLGQQYGGGSTTGTYREPDAKAKLYFKSNGVLFANVHAFTGSHYEVYPTAGVSVMKTWKDSCKPVAAGSVSGIQCSFSQWNSSGEVISSGWAVMYTSGDVYIRWYYHFTAGVQRIQDSGWVPFYVAP